jgi:hypothetical protein
MKRMLVALLMLGSALTLCPHPADAAVVIVTTGPGFYAPGYYRGPVVTGTTPIHTGTPVIGGVDVDTTVNWFSRSGASRPGGAKV